MKHGFWILIAVIALGISGCKKEHEPKHTSSQSKVTPTASGENQRATNNADKVTPRIANTSGVIDKKEVAKCAKISGDLNRLGCYDTLATNHKLDKPQPLPVKITGTGKWIISRDKNPIDDSERVVIMLIADSGAGRFGNDVTFFARCKSNKTEVYINWNDYLGDDSSSVYEDWKRVTVRIGDNPAKTQQWNVSTDKKATFAPSWPGDLLKKMAQSSKFIVQVTPYNESPVTAIFDTTGMKNALKPLAQACKWDGK